MTPKAMTDAPAIDLDLYAEHVDRVQPIEAKSPGRLRNNTLQGIAQLPARFIPD